MCPCFSFQFFSHGSKEVMSWSQGRRTSEMCTRVSTIFTSILQVCIPYHYNISSAVCLTTSLSIYTYLPILHTGHNYVQAVQIHSQRNVLMLHLPVYLLHNLFVYVVKQYLLHLVIVLLIYIHVLSVMMNLSIVVMPLPSLPT